MKGNARIRVMHVLHGLGAGGTEKTMQLLVTGVDKKRFLPCVFSFEPGEREDSIRKSGIPVMIGGDLFAALQQFAPHIVHLHRAGWPERAVMRSLLLHRGSADLPKIVETNVFGRYDPTPDGRAIDMHLFVSDFCRERYGRIVGIDLFPERHRVLYNPVDTECFARLCPQRAALHSPPVVGRLSRADRGKWSSLAWEFLPHALKALPGLRYRVIGMVEEAQAFFEHIGVAESVEVLPPVLGDDALAAFFNSIDLLAHANDTGESFGLVIAEAMAAGLPIVTHPAVGERDNAQLELVEHGVTGYVATGAKEYAAAVVSLLQDPARALAMGEAGREKAAREFAAPVVVKQLEDIYMTLLQGV